MWWLIVGVVAIWTLVAVIAGVRIGRAIHNADTEDEADRLRRNERERTGDPMTPTRNGRQSTQQS